MKPAPFEYLAPGSVEEAISLLGQYGEEAKLLAGGQSLMPLLNMRLARPAALIDLRRVAGLDSIRETRGTLAVGAMVSKRAVEQSPLVRKRQPLLHAATLLIGHPPIRNRGTLGGSLAQADPAAEYPAVALALDAELRVAGPAGERTIPARDFFVTTLTTALGAGEVLREVRWPTLPRRTGWAIQEIARRRGDFAIAGTATTLSLDRKGRASAARIALFGVRPTPVRALRAEEMLVGERPGEPLFERVAEAAAEDLDEPLSDVHASAEYRRHLTRVLIRRALAEANTRVGEGARA